MTYDKLIDILINRNNEGLETLGKVKIVVFDECHTLFSDSFITDIEAVKVWIRDTINLGEKIVIGMTATPGILHYNTSRWGVGINQINRKPIINYKAKQMICTDFKSLPHLINVNKLQGRTIIMCQSIRDCYELQSHLSNAAVLISKNSNKGTDPKMERIRQYIVQNESLPETFEYLVRLDADDQPVYETRPLEVLICTSTVREGINIREESGVRNVVSCFSDELHVTQFAGRCRYDLDTIVVAGSYVRADNFNQNEYLQKQRREYDDFLALRGNLSWFNSVSHLVNHSINEVIRIKLNGNEVAFVNYVNKRWLVPIGAEDVTPYKIWREEDKREIVNMVQEAGFFKLAKDRLTFIKVIRMMQNSLGYKIEGGRMQIDKQRHLYKLVIEHKGSSLGLIENLTIYGGV